MNVDYLEHVTISRETGNKVNAGTITFIHFALIDVISPNHDWFLGYDWEWHEIIEYDIYKMIS